MPSSSTLTGVAAFVVAALVAVGAVYALAGMWHGGTSEQAGQPMAQQVGPAAGGFEAPMAPGSGPGFGDCWMEGMMGGMEFAGEVVEVSGVVVGFDSESMELIVETGDGERIAVKVAGVYVDGETGALVFGPWIAASLGEGTMITLKVVEVSGYGDSHGYDGMGDSDSMRRSGMEEGYTFTMALGIEVEDGKEYIHPMLVLSDMMGGAMSNGHDENNDYGYGHAGMP